MATFWAARWSLQILAIWGHEIYGFIRCCAAAGRAPLLGLEISCNIWLSGHCQWSTKVRTDHGIFPPWASCCCTCTPGNLSPRHRHISLHIVCDRHHRGSHLWRGHVSTGRVVTSHLDNWEQTILCQWIVDCADTCSWIWLTTTLSAVRVAGQTITKVLQPDVQAGAITLGHSRWAVHCPSKV